MNALLVGWQEMPRLNAKEARERDTDRDRETEKSSERNVRKYVLRLR